MCNVLGICLRFLDSCSKYVRRVCFYCANKRWSILCHVNRLFAFHTDFSRIFHPRFLVPYFPVLHFHVLHFCATFSSLAFSSPAVLCRIAIPAFSSPAFFLVPHFHVSHFQSPPSTIVHTPNFHRFVFWARFVAEWHILQQSVWRSE